MTVLYIDWYNYQNLENRKMARDKSKIWIVLFTRKLIEMYQKYFHGIISQPITKLNGISYRYIEIYLYRFSIIWCYWW